MQQEQNDRSGWDTFAAVIMFAIGFTRLISSIQILRGVRSLTHVAGSSLVQSATGSGTPSETMQAMSSQLSALQQQATASAESAGCGSSTSSTS